MGCQMGVGPNGTGNKVTAAVRADVAEAVFRAIGAEGAFIGADPGVGCRWRKVFVAAFAVWSEFQHMISFQTVGID